jgi:hypothetical protein
MPLNYIKISFIGLVLILSLNSCAGGMPGADAKKFPPNPDERIKRNLEEGRGIRINNVLNNKGGGDFEFASSNELWRASLDILDFMPLVSANYSGGIIITDWFSRDNKDSIKITLRFLTNEVRSDAIDIKVFYKKCNLEMRCTITQQEGNIEKELKKEILKKAAIYKKQTTDKNFKPYQLTDLKD